ncbi:hypothetical protein EV2_014649 [Malus domestica]
MWALPGHGTGQPACQVTEGAVALTLLESTRVRVGPRPTTLMLAGMHLTMGLVGPSDLERPVPPPSNLDGTMKY